VRAAGAPPVPCGGSGSALGGRGVHRLADEPRAARGPGEGVEAVQQVLRGPSAGLVVRLDAGRARGRLAREAEGAGQRGQRIGVPDEPDDEVARDRGEAEARGMLGAARAAGRSASRTRSPERSRIRVSSRSPTKLTPAASRSAREARGQS
jgi:hypothetical protein